MALRKIGGLIKLSTKAGLAGGTIYLYYEAGLWKGTDETIENYDKLKKDIRVLYEANPDVKKWTEYVTSSISTNVKPYSQAVTDFRKEWLNFDLSGVSSPINGVIKPGWNKGVAFVAEAIADSPETIQNWGSQGWKKLSELASDPQTGSSASGKADKPASKA